MKNNKKVTETMKVCEGADAVIPDEIKPLELIQKVFEQLKEWNHQGKKRGYLLIATCDTHDKDYDAGMAIASGGDDEVLAQMMCVALENNKEFQNMLMGAFKLSDQANQ